MIVKKILETIRSHDLIRENQHIVLGLSGGPDSVCLFHVLQSLASEMKLSLHPVHVNHRLRPGAADEDQRFAEALCEKAGCRCSVFSFDCSAYARREKITDEEAGRKLRYEAFARTAAELCESGVDRGRIRIAVAQNAEDQAETILFRILRGTGVDGLAGMRYERKDEYGNTIIRPLLDVHREEILEYCREHRLNPRVDETNFLPVYSRNKIRLQLFPYLEREYNPEIKDTMIRMGKTAAMDADFLRQQAQLVYPEVIRERGTQHVTFRGDRLRGLHRAVRQRVLAAAFSELGLREDLSFVHFEHCENIVFHDGPSARCDLPRGCYLTKVYDDVKAAAGGEDCPADFACEVMFLRDFAAREKETGAYAAFDYDRLEAAFGPDFEKRLRLSVRQPGDFIAIAGGKRKKIQDLFVDQKIPKDQREGIKLLKIGSEVLWMPIFGQKGRYTANFKLSETTKKVICIEIIW